jgi:hypothetical protein
MTHTVEIEKRGEPRPYKAVYRGRTLASFDTEAEAKAYAVKVGRILESSSK